MGAMTAAIVGMGVMSAATSVMGGMAQNKEAKQNANAVRDEAAYNAGVYRQQEVMVENQKQLKAQQDARQIRFAAGKTAAVTAAKGIEMTGSPMAILLDTMTQMEMDKAITGYNYDMEKYRLESEARSVEYRGNTIANAYLRQGKTAMMGGIVGGLTTLAGTALYAGARMYEAPNKTTTTTPPKNSINTSGGATKGGAV